MRKIIGVVLMMLLGGGVVLADCPTYEGTFWAGECDTRPHSLKAFHVKKYTHNGQPYLFVDTGDDLAMYKARPNGIPYAHTTYNKSNFGFGFVGDGEYYLNGYYSADEAHFIWVAHRLGVGLLYINSDRYPYAMFSGAWKFSASYSSSRGNSGLVYRVGDEHFVLTDAFDFIHSNEEKWSEAQSEVAGLQYCGSESVARIRLIATPFSSLAYRLSLEWVGCEPLPNTLDYGTVEGGMVVASKMLLSIYSQGGAQVYQARINSDGSIDYDNHAPLFYAQFNRSSPVAIDQANQLMAVVNFPSRLVHIRRWTDGGGVGAILKTIRNLRSPRNLALEDGVLYIGEDGIWDIGDLNNPVRKAHFEDYFDRFVDVPWNLDGYYCLSTFPGVIDQGKLHLPRTGLLQTFDVSDCSDPEPEGLIFRDGFESGDLGAWQ